MDKGPNTKIFDMVHKALTVLRENGGQMFEAALLGQMTAAGLYVPSAWKVDFFQGLILNGVERTHNLISLALEIEIPKIQNILMPLSFFVSRVEFEVVELPIYTFSTPLASEMSWPEYGIVTPEASTKVANYLNVSGRWQFVFLEWEARQNVTLSDFYLYRGHTESGTKLTGLRFFHIRIGNMVLEGPWRAVEVQIQLPE